MKGLVLISHFYNEEFLLPFWLEHNLKIFDHAVLINYQSTDNSVDIIREMAPSWEIRPSRNMEFDAHMCDDEVRDVEKLFPGYWKTTINVTEFLVCGDIRAVIERCERQSPHLQGFHVHGGVMVDKVEDRDAPITDEPLIFQKHHGYLESWEAGSRHRIFHNQNYGLYQVGRHWWGIEDNVGGTDEAYCMWFGYCPVDKVKSRTLQIQHRMSAHDRHSGLGGEHIMTEEDYEQKYLNMAARSVDLLENDGYRKQLEAMKRDVYGIQS